MYILYIFIVYYNFYNNIYTYKIVLLEAMQHQSFQQLAVNQFEILSTVYQILMRWKLCAIFSFIKIHAIYFNCLFHEYFGFFFY